MLVKIYKEISLTILIKFGTLTLKSRLRQRNLITIEDRWKITRGELK